MDFMSLTSLSLSVSVWGMRLVFFSSASLQSMQLPHTLSQLTSLPLHVVATFMVKQEYKQCGECMMTQLWIPWMLQYAVYGRNCCAGSCRF
jgi:hypothetical protein